MATTPTKVYICQKCDNFISYAPEDVGDTLICPKCGTKNRLDKPPPLPAIPAVVVPRKKAQCRKPCLVMGCCGCLTAVLLPIVIALVGFWVVLPLSSLPPELQQRMAPLANMGILPQTAPAPIAWRHSDVSVAVREMRVTCPEIYQAAIRQSAVTERPLFCVTLTIANNGAAPVSYRTWRHLKNAGDINQAATLENAAGALHGIVSYGPETWPVGGLQRAVIDPGRSATDVLLFTGEGRVPGDYLLTLPAANIGSSGNLRFRIPAALVADDAAAATP